MASIDYDGIRTNKYNSYPNDFRLTAEGATQPNELIYLGAIRDGKNADLVVKENTFG